MVFARSNKSISHLIRNPHTPSEMHFNFSTIPTPQLRYSDMCNARMNEWIWMSTESVTIYCCSIAFSLLVQCTVVRMFWPMSVSLLQNRKCSLSISERFDQHKITSDHYNDENGFILNQQFSRLIFKITYGILVLTTKFLYQRNKHSGRKSWPVQNIFSAV